MKLPLVAIFFAISSWVTVTKAEEPTQAKEQHPAVKALTTWAKAFQKDEVKPEQSIFRPEHLGPLKAMNEEGDDFTKSLANLIVKDSKLLTFKHDGEEKNSGWVLKNGEPVLPMALNGERWQFDAAIFDKIAASAKVSVADQDLMVFQTALEQYKLIGGSYPSEKQGLIALHKKPDTAPRPRRWVQLVRKVEAFNDPWGHPYQYKLVEGRPVITSLGPDGKVSKDDISSE